MIVKWDMPNVVSGEKLPPIGNIAPTEFNYGPVFLDGECEGFGVFEKNIFENSENLRAWERYLDTGR